MGSEKGQTDLDSFDTNKAPIELYVVRLFPPCRAVQLYMLQVCQVVFLTLLLEVLACVITNLISFIGLIFGVKINFYNKKKLPVA